ncbi:MAG: 16S rRNA (guanine(527)-N(7))-methyltransferase RsmG [Bacilli bacterium]
MNQNDFINELSKLGIFLSEAQLTQLDVYYNRLIEYNIHTNLTRITNKEDVYLKHFYDSLTLIKAYDLNNNSSLCDIGTGAGFPGLVLKIVFPNLKITLVDSLNKRIIFLNNLIEELGLKDVSCVHKRAEEFSSENIEQFDIVTCRAVAKLNVLIEICVPMLKIGGMFIPMKSEITDEISHAQKALKQLNAEILELLVFELPKEKSKRTLIIIKKLKKSKSIYPRKFSEIKKKPL